MRVGTKDKGFRVVLDLNDRARYSIKEKESRLEITVKALCLNPKNGSLPSPGTKYSLINRGSSSLLTLELQKNAKILFFSSTAKNPSRIVLDVVSEKKIAPRKDSQKVSPTKETGERPPKDSPKIDVAKTQGLVPKKSNKAIKGEQAINIRLTQKDLPVKQLLSSRSFYFYVSPTWTPLEGGYLELVLSHSELLNPQVSNVTISLNGVPMRSIPLNKENLWKGYVSIPLDPKVLRPKTNEVVLTALARTYEERCADIDSPGNWYRIHKESLVHLRYLQKESLPLSKFPSPYFEPNQYKIDNTLLVVSDSPAPEELTGAYRLLLQWSLEAPGKQIRAGIRRLSEITPGLASSMNLIYLGKAKEFPSQIHQAFGVPANLAGKVYMKTFSNSQGLGRMCIMGENSKDTLFGVQALIAPEVRRQMNTSTTLLSCATPLPGKKYPQEIGTDITFERLAIPDIAMRGVALHHQGDLSFRIPPQWDIHGNPKLVLFFRHAPNLDEAQSSLEVDINDIPQRGETLTPENAEGGRFVIPLKKESILEDYINVDIRSYLDIGALDCSRFYTESAWLVVDKKSYFHLPHRVKQLKPLLENLPYAFLRPQLKLYISPKVGGKELSALGDVLKSWQVQMLAPLDVEVLPLPGNFNEASMEQNRVVLASMEELHNRGLSLSVGYSREENSFISGPRVPVVQPFGNEAMLFQIIPTGKSVTLVMSWSKPAYQKELLSKILTRQKLKGDTCLVSPGGEVVSFYLTEKAPSENGKGPGNQDFSLEGFLDFLKGSRKSLGFFSLAILLIGAILLFSFLRTLRRR